MKQEYTAHLSPWQYKVIVEKATDPPSDGGYTNHFREGTYHCRACNAPLYRSEAKFDSGCGWPAFDEEIPGAVIRKPDFSHDIVRMEILCAGCGGHLGHVFEGEGYTPKNVRHCVNSSSLIFHTKDKEELLIGVPDFHLCQELTCKTYGVVSVECGFASCRKLGLYAEALRIEYDPKQTTSQNILHELLKLTNQQLNHYSGKWYIFSRGGHDVPPDIPPEFVRAVLDGYHRAPEEHQWFYRKAAIRLHTH